MTQIETERTEEVLEHFEDSRASLIPLLQEVQTVFHYLPEEVLRRISRKLGVPLAQVYQVATFYRCFSLVPVGKHVIQVCLGTACHVRGGPRVLDRLLRGLKLGSEGTTPDLEFTVRSVRCLGCCGLAPVVQVDRGFHPHMTQAKVDGLLKRYRAREKERMPQQAVPAEEVEPR